MYSADKLLQFEHYRKIAEQLPEENAYVSFLDDDDLLMPTRIQELRTQLELNYDLREFESTRTQDQDINVVFYTRPVLQFRTGDFGCECHVFGVNFESSR